MEVAPLDFGRCPAPDRVTLVAVSGPRPYSFELTSGNQYAIGRRTSHALAIDHPEISKDHAVIECRHDRSSSAGVALTITDTNSRHGTKVNGVTLEPGRECPIAVGDLIEISPWTFCIMNRTPSGGGARLSTVDDTEPGGSTVTAIHAEVGGALAQERLRLLLRCAETLPRATTERSLAETVLETAVAGTGYGHAAIIRPMTPDGAVELITATGEIGAARGQARLSRSLINAASHGSAVQLSSSARPLREAVSIAEFGIQEAICVPLLVESTIAGYLYLDRRGRSNARNVGANEACAFAVGVGRLASMAWANLMRLELERRYARMEGELSAAARAQRMILPKRQGCCGGIQYLGECRPGRMISGDFFDIFQLPDDKVAVTIGDVSGKGVAASVVMTTAQGFLHGALRQHGDVERAVRDLNAYVHERCESQIFVTLWAGVFDVAKGTLTYTDAGHGYVWLIPPLISRSDQSPQFKCSKPNGLCLDDSQNLVCGPLDVGLCTPLNEHGGPPVAAMPDSEYSAALARLQPGGRVLLVSDGIVEQPPAKFIPGGQTQFGKDRVLECLAKLNSESDEVIELFAAVEHFAGRTDLADDATVVLVQW